jgi:hypothetical protein
VPVRVDNARLTSAQLDVATRLAAGERQL